jgi:hypothetical protein
VTVPLPDAVVAAAAAVVNDLAARWLNGTSDVPPTGENVAAAILRHVACTPAARVAVTSSAISERIIEDTHAASAILTDLRRLVAEWHRDAASRPLLGDPTGPAWHGAADILQALIDHHTPKGTT